MSLGIELQAPCELAGFSTLVGRVRLDVKKPFNVTEVMLQLDGTAAASVSETHRKSIHSIDRSVELRYSETETRWTSCTLASLLFCADPLLLCLLKFAKCCPDRETGDAVCARARLAVRHL